MLSNCRNALTTQAKSEAKLLETPRVTVPTSHTNRSYKVNEESVKVPNMFYPVTNSVYTPVLAIGDGNCLYREVSLTYTALPPPHTHTKIVLHRY